MKLFAVGAKVFIRTVTYHVVGEVTNWFDIGPAGFIALKDAAWVADSGRFTQALANGTLNEVEPVGECIIATGAIVDVFPWRHELPLAQK